MSGDPGYKLLGKNIKCVFMIIQNLNSTFKES